MSERTELNARGLLCPLPVIRTQDAIKKLQSGDRLRIFATDPGTMHDIPAWVRVHGHLMHEAREDDAEFYFEIEIR